MPVRRGGRGEVVVLVHGVPGDVDTLAPVADRLADAYEAITLDMWPSGPKGGAARGFGTAEWCSDLAAALPSLARGPVHLVAWSFGAHAALVLAVLRPELVRSLLVYEPGFATFVSDAADLRRVDKDAQAAFGPVFEALWAGDEGAAIRCAIDAAAGEAGWYDRQPGRLRAIHRRNACQLALLPAQSPPVPLGAADLAAIACPTTVAWGMRTRPCYAIVSRTAARLVPGARAVEVEGATHLLPEQDPSAFAKVVRAHLDRSRSSQG